MPHAPSIRLRCNPRRRYQRQRPRGPRTSKAMPSRLAETEYAACPLCIVPEPVRCLRAVDEVESSR
eukprot:807438-Prymnesium_polylepis.1